MRALEAECVRAHLRPFPDAAPALRALADLGYELAVLSNGTPAMIASCLGNSGLGEFFGQRISADEVRAFKPSPVVCTGTPPGGCRWRRGGALGGLAAARGLVPIWSRVICPDRDV